MPFRRLPPMHALRAYEAVARCGSFKRAAAELNVTPAALSQQVKKLEQDLDVALLTRHNRLIVPTAEGMRLKTGLSDAFLRIREAVNSVRPGGNEEKGLTVSCGPPVAAKWLAPRMHQFLDLYPDINLSIASKRELVNYHDENIDVGIRLSRDDSDDLEREWLYEETVVALCSPSFVAKHKLREPKDVLRVPILRDDGLNYCRGPVWEVWLKEAGLAPTAAQRGTHFGYSPEQGLDAAVAGAGIIVASKTLASQDLELKRLVIPFGPEVKLGVRYQIVHRKQAKRCEYLEAFKAWLRDELKPSDFAPMISTKRS
ncbi:MAG: LysR substrate-binding domain-containing protein [Pseudomonadota bacterium]